MGPPAAFPLSPGQGRGGRLLFGEPRELWSSFSGLCLWLEGPGGRMEQEAASLFSHCNFLQQKTIGARSGVRRVCFSLRFFFPFSFGGNQLDAYQPRRQIFSSFYLCSVSVTCF